MSRLWQRVPALVRGLVLGELVSTVGGLAALFSFWNLRFLPTLPWLLPATAAWLWLFWRYVDGGGWPVSSRAARHRLLRATKVAPPLWRSSLLAGALALVSLDALAFLTQRLAAIPAEAFKLPIDLSRYPVWMVVSILLAISALAGVSEEAGYRGYMLTEIADRHGWVAATLVTGFVFFLDHHWSHAYATFAFLPFFMIVSAVHARLVYLTGSIVPSIVLHSVFDFLVIPVQFGLVGGIPMTSVWATGVDISFLLELAVCLAFGAAAVPVFTRLAKQARANPPPTSPRV